MFSVTRTAANIAWALSGLPHHAAFRRSLGDTEHVQATLLKKLLSENAASEFGKRHRFAAIKSVREYQDAVPVSSYEDLEASIERIKSGQQNVLCREPVLAFETTSGSTGATKLIPNTATLLHQFQRAIGAWMWDLYANVPGLARGSSYWCLTPLSREPEGTSGGIRIGLPNDLAYFGRWSRMWLRRTLAVPPAVAKERNLDDCLYATCLSLLRSPDLAFISIWNPSFLTLLLDFIEQHADRLLKDLSVSNRKRARSLGEQRQTDGRFNAEFLWPKLRLISCWADAAANPALSPLRESFPNVAVQGKGLLATEGVVSIPLVGHRGHCLAITSHFLEFEASAGKRPQLPQELNRGEEYTVIITTGGGLWRYRLGDRVRVHGHIERTPLIEFIGREGGISDLRGEKLNPLFIAEVLEQWKRAVAWKGAFAMLAPVDAATPFYTLFVDGTYRAQTATEVLDQLVCANSHYAYCRQLGQLGSARIFSIQSDAGASYLRRCVSLGQRAGNVKPACLHQAFGWEEVFHGQFEHDGGFKHNQSSIAV